MRRGRPRPPGHLRRPRRRPVGQTHRRPLGQPRRRPLGQPRRRPLGRPRRRPLGHPAVARYPRAVGCPPIRRSGGNTLRRPVGRQRVAATAVRRRPARRTQAGRPPPVIPAGAPPDPVLWRQHAEKTGRGSACCRHNTSGDGGTRPRPAAPARHLRRAPPPASPPGNLRRAPPPALPPSPALAPRAGDPIPCCGGNPLGNRPGVSALPPQPVRGRWHPSGDGGTSPGTVAPVRGRWHPPGDGGTRPRQPPGRVPRPRHNGLSAGSRTPGPRRCARSGPGCARSGPGSTATQGSTPEQAGARRTWAGPGT